MIPILVYLLTVLALALVLSGYPQYPDRHDGPGTA